MTSSGGLGLVGMGQEQRAGRGDSRVTTADCCGRLGSDPGRGGPCSMLSLEPIRVLKALGAELYIVPQGPGPAGVAPLRICPSIRQSHAGQQQSCGAPLEYPVAPSRTAAAATTADQEPRRRGGGSSPAGCPSREHHRPATPPSSRACRTVGNEPFPLRARRSSRRSLEMPPSRRRPTCPRTCSRSG